MFNSPKQKQRRHVPLHLKLVVSLEHVRLVVGHGRDIRSGRHGR